MVVLRKFSLILVVVRFLLADWSSFELLLSADQVQVPFLEVNAIKKKRNLRTIDSQSRKLGPSWARNSGREVMKSRKSRSWIPGCYFSSITLLV